MVSGQKILEKFPNLIYHMGGDIHLQATQTCSCEEPQKHSLCFIPTQKWLTPCLKAGVSIAVIHSKIKAPPSFACCILSTPQLSLAISLLSKEFFSLSPPQIDGQQIHPSAVISKNASVEKSAIIAPNAVISEGVSIGPHSYIGANSYVGPHSSIGHHTWIAPNVTIHHKVTIGNHCRIQSQSSVGSDGYGYGRDEKKRYHFKPHYGGVRLEDFVELGSGCQVDRGVFKDTVIGEGSKIDNLCHIAHNVVIGKDCLLLAGVVIAGSCRIGNQCILGGGTYVRDHINMADGVRCNHSLITDHITQPGGSYGLFFNVPLKQSIKALKTLTHLPELKKKVEKLWSNR